MGRYVASEEKGVLRIRSGSLHLRLEVGVLNIGPSAFLGGV